eukprot:TRINITY_DN15805_c0_g1_i1.p1 TRINITY_DN15805_c0_g1~~TRINITY_DN15805_c0_g1_i1.p1  ORF type:complete len:297 (-),score=34.76 TRINITY_DN15805_c0_g1_i1:627-1517(-)
MSMSAFQALIFGMGGAAAYQYRDVLLEMFSNSSGGNFDTKTAQLTQVNQRMSKDVEELRRILSEQYRQQPQGVTVVHSGAKSGTAVLAYPALAVAAYLAYLRIVKGYKLVDLMYVSKAALQQSIVQVQDGIKGVKEQMESAKKFLQKQMDQLSDHQKLLMSAQENMGLQLTQVDTNIYETKESVEQVSGAVRQLDDRMINVVASQQYTQQGVYALCAAVQEIMCINGMKSSHANTLTDFLQNSPPIRIEQQHRPQLASASNDQSLGLQGLQGFSQQFSRRPMRQITFDRVEEIKDT